MCLNLCQILQNNSLAETFKSDGSKNMVNMWFFGKKIFAMTLTLQKFIFMNLLSLENKKAFRL